MGVCVLDKLSRPTAPTQVQPHLTREARGGRGDQDAPLLLGAPLGEARKRRGARHFEAVASR
jgi:hypothetical protein